MEDKGLSLRQRPMGVTIWMVMYPLSYRRAQVVPKVLYDT